MTGLLLVWRCQVYSARSDCPASRSLRGEFPVFVNVGAGGKSAFPGAGDDDGAHPVVVFVVGDGLVQLARQLQIEGVKHFGPVEGDHSDVGFNFVAAHHGGAGHGFGADAGVGGGDHSVVVLSSRLF